MATRINGKGDKVNAVKRSNGKPKQKATPATDKRRKPANVKPTDVFGGFQYKSAVVNAKRMPKGFTATTTAGGQLRVTGAYNLTQLIKWCTVQGYSRQQTIGACELLLGVTPNTTTLGCHRTAGESIRRGVAPSHHAGPVAEVAGADAKRVAAKVGKPEGDGMTPAGRKLLASM